jgi:hypothetical protein
MESRIPPANLYIAIDNSFTHFGSKTPFKSYGVIKDFPMLSSFFALKLAPRYRLIISWIESTASISDICSLTNVSCTIV